MAGKQDGPVYGPPTQFESDRAARESYTAQQEQPARPAYGPSQAANLLAAMPDPDVEARYRHQLAAESFERGRALGRAEHIAAAAAAQAAAREAPDPETIDAINRAAAAQHAEMEERRWGPGGRQHFADPRPGDYAGRGKPPVPHPEQEHELEAG
jgi:hypothetical protein